MLLFSVLPVFRFFCIFFFLQFDPLKSVKLFGGFMKYFSILLLWFPFFISNCCVEFRRVKKCLKKSFVV